MTHEMQNLRTIKHFMAYHSLSQSESSESQNQHSPSSLLSAVPGIEPLTTTVPFSLRPSLIMFANLMDIEEEMKKREQTKSVKKKNLKRKLANSHNGNKMG